MTEAGTTRAIEKSQRKSALHADGGRLADLPVQRVVYHKPVMAKPNIVLINLDDADVESLNDVNLHQYFPHMRALASQGIRFTNCHVTTPLCGPSRACLLRGQYAHATGVKSNGPAFLTCNQYESGFDTYEDRGHHRDDLPVWMKRQGYQTAFAGKYLHPVSAPINLPSWDRFTYFQGGEYFDCPRYTFENGAFSFGTSDELRTEVETRRAEEIIRTSFQESDQPLFFYLAPYAPHRGAGNTPMNRLSHLQSFGGFQPQRSPTFNESDISDKPSSVRALRPLASDVLQRSDELVRNRMAALQEVDRMVGRIIKALRDQQRLENTYVILTSDNGYLFGQHRLLGKQFPYDEATRVPLLIRGPGISGGQVANHLVSHIDLAPTLVEIAGGSPPPFVNGKSFLPLLKNPTAIEEDAWRDCVMIENWQSSIVAGQYVHSLYCGLRGYAFSYMEWANGDSEYYDLRTDPHQQFNIADSLPAERRAWLRQRLRQIKKQSSTTAITARVLEPYFNVVPESDQVLIVGSAEADEDIDRVNLVIYHQQRREFWNGTDWQKERFIINPELTSRRRTLVLWQYRIPGDALDLSTDDRQIRVFTRAANHHRVWSDVPMSTLMGVERLIARESAVSSSSNARQPH